MKKTSKIKARILQYADFKGFSKTRIYKDSGISNGTLDKSTGITEHVLDKFLKAYPDVDPVWLITGEGNSPLRATDPTLDDYSMVHEQSALYGMKLSQDEIDRRASAVRQLRMQLAEDAIPLVSNSVAAGFGSSDFMINDDDVIDYYVLPNLKDKGAEFLVKVDGDSMEPKFKAGDIVGCKVIHEDSFIQHNRPYLVSTDQGLLLKRLTTDSENAEYYNLHSDNENYPWFRLQRENIHGVAIIVGYIRPE